MDDLPPAPTLVFHIVLFLIATALVSLPKYACSRNSKKQTKAAFTNFCSHLAHFTETVLTKNNPDPLSYTRHAGPFAFEADVAFIDDFANYRANKGYMSASCERVHLHAREDALVTINKINSRHPCIHSACQIQSVCMLTSAAAISLHQVAEGTHFRSRCQRPIVRTALESDTCILKGYFLGRDKVCKRLVYFGKGLLEMMCNTSVI